MNHNFSRLLRGLFAFLDLMILNAVFFFSMYLFGISIRTSKSPDYYYFALFSNVVWLAACWIHSIYQGQNTASFEKFVKRTFRAYTLFIVAEFIYLYFTRELQVSRFFTITFLLAFPSCVMLIAWPTYLSIYILRRKNTWSSVC